MPNDANPDERNGVGDMPLHYGQTPEIINLLSDAGANINAKGEYDSTP
jgi:hypothetical protein